QKARTNRYGTAQELADELRRFLRGEPIQARPISQIARFWRLCRRHPLTSSAIAAAAVFLIAASIVSTGAYFWTKQMLQRETAALGQEKMAKALAQEKKAEADRKRSQAMQAVNDLFTIVSEDTLLNQPGTQPVR